GNERTVKHSKNTWMKIGISAALLCGIAAALVAQTASDTKRPAAVPVRSTPTTAAKAGPRADGVKYRALVDKYCVACHNARTANPAEGPVNLEAAAFDDLLGHAGAWERVIRKLS